MTKTQRLDLATGGNVAAMSALSSVVVKVVTGLLMAAVLGGVGMFIRHGNDIQDIRAKLQVIEATRYTQSDAQNDQSKILNTLSDIRIALAGVNQSLADINRRLKDN